MSKKPDRVTWKTARALRFRIANKGEIRASVSASAGEFNLTTDLIELLRLVEEDPQISARALAEKLKGHLRNLHANSPSAAECSELLESMAEAGVLINTAQTAQKPQVGLADGFGDTWIQWAMIADQMRCKQYQKAISESVNSQSHVLDIGAGLGFLSYCALISGAQSCFAIEETSSVQLIEPILKKAGLKNLSNLKIHHSHSGDAPLPPQLTHIVSELFGNDPFQEGILPTLREVAVRAGNRKINYIPQSVSLYAQLIDLKASPVFQRIAMWQKFARSNTAQKNSYENFLQSAAFQIPNGPLSFACALDSQDFTKCSAEIETFKLELNPPPQQNPEAQKRSLKITALPQTPVILLWFRAHLTEKIALSSGPGQADHCGHWSPILIPLNETLSLDCPLILKCSIDQMSTSFLFEVYQNERLIGQR